MAGDIFQPDIGQAQSGISPERGASVDFSGLASLVPDRKEIPPGGDLALELQELNSGIQKHKSVLAAEEDIQTQIGEHQKIIGEFGDTAESLGIGDDAVAEDLEFRRQRVAKLSGDLKAAKLAQSQGILNQQTARIIQQSIMKQHNMETGGIYAEEFQKISDAVLGTRTGKGFQEFGVEQSIEKNLSENTIQMYGTDSTQNRKAFTEFTNNNGKLEFNDQQNFPTVLKTATDKVNVNIGALWDQEIVKQFATQGFLNDETLKQIQAKIIGSRGSIEKFVTDEIAAGRIKQEHKSAVMAQVDKTIDEQITIFDGMDFKTAAEGFKKARQLYIDGVTGIDNLANIVKIDPIAGIDGLMNLVGAYRGDDNVKVKINGLLQAANSQIALGEFDQRTVEKMITQAYTLSLQGICPPGVSGGLCKFMTNQRAALGSQDAADSRQVGEPFDLVELEQMETRQEFRKAVANVSNPDASRNTMANLLSDVATVKDQGVLVVYDPVANEFTGFSRGIKTGDAGGRMLNTIARLYDLDRATSEKLFGMTKDEFIRNAATPQGIVEQDPAFIVEDVTLTDEATSFRALKDAAGKGLGALQQFFASNPEIAKKVMSQDAP